ncbi:MAG: ABC transporter substrate-binding protein [Thermodesulfobacteriota bacterium]
MKKTALILAAALLLTLPVSAGAGQQPQEAIRGPMDQAVAILDNPAYKNADKALQQKQRAELKLIIDPVFDYTEIAKRALARNWLVFSTDERREFRDLFTEFLSNIYLAKIQKAYAGEKILVTGQDMVAPGKAVVHTKVVLKDGFLPIDYSVYEKEGGWRIYDVNVEGVSLVKNYRSQFEKILVNEKPASLIKTLQEKVEKQRTGDIIED